MNREQSNHSGAGQTRTDASPWEPLSKPLFRSLWIAAIASNMATWMHDVGAAWLMTSLAPSPLMVSMVQASTSLPLFVLALPAGAFADVFDRRRLLLLTQAWMLVAAAGLAMLTAIGITGPLLLLGFTFAIGIGTAFNAPAWQAIVPEIVSREEMPSAVALNSAGINLARAVGPALGGLIVARLGPQAAFGLNALSFIGVIFILYRWRREKPVSSLPSEHLFSAMIAGIRFARYAAGFRNALGRAFLFVFPASALWALLPLFARQELNLGAGGYGILLGAVGLGAVCGAYFLPRLRQKIAVDKLTSGATVIYAVVLLAMAMLRNVPLMVPVMLITGAMWITMLTALNVSAQSVAAGWVRARVLSVYLVVFSGSMAIGSIICGALATALTMTPVLLIAAAVALIGTFANRWLPLSSTEGIDLSPSLHWPTPNVEMPNEDDKGTALVTVEYHINPSEEAKFRCLMHLLRASRLRDGAIQWHLFNDPEVNGRYLEVFMVGSWIEHLRQHERVTESDREIQQKVRVLLKDDTEPLVSHFIAERTET